MEKEESPTDATQEEDVDDMEGSGEEGDLEGSDSEAASGLTRSSSACSEAGSSSEPHWPALPLSTSVD